MGVRQHQPRLRVLRWIRSRSPSFDGHNDSVCVDAALLVPACATEQALSVEELWAAHEP